MELTFIFPAKVGSAERNLSGEFFEHGGRKFLAVPGNVYIESATGKIKVQENGIFSIFLASDKNIYIRSSESIPRFCEWLEILEPGLKNRTFDNSIEIVSNPEEYERKFKENKAIRDAENLKSYQEQERVKAEREEKTRIANEQALAKSVEDYKKGEYIPWAHFEELCAKNGINIHIKVKGWGRAKCRLIGFNGGRVQTKSAGVWKYTEELKKALD